MTVCLELLLTAELEFSLAVLYQIDGWRVFSVADFGYGADGGLSVSAM